MFRKISNYLRIIKLAREALNDRHFNRAMQFAMVYYKYSRHGYSPFVNSIVSQALTGHVTALFDKGMMALRLSDKLGFVEEAFKYIQEHQEWLEPDSREAVVRPLYVMVSEIIEF